MRRLLAAAIALLCGASVAQADCGKVSACGVASTPLSGAEVIYIVQAGVSKKITVATLQLGLTISGTSGGIPYYNSPTSLLSSSAGAANAFMLWGGVGNAPKAVAINGLVRSNGAGAPAAYGGTSCATDQVLTGLDLNGSGACGAVSLLNSHGANFVAPEFFSGSTAGAAVLAVMGASGTPDTTINPAVVIEKFTSSTNTTTQNPGVFISMIKSGANGSNPATSATALSVEVDDLIGSATNSFPSYVEGIKARAVLRSGSSLGQAEAAVLFAQNDCCVSYTHLIVVEAEVDNNYQNAPATLDPTHQTVAYLANSGGAFQSDAAFMVNPSLGVIATQSAAFRTGFLVPAGSGAISTPVVDSAFRSDAATKYGLNLVNAFGITDAAIIVPNNSVALKAENGAGNAELTLISTDTSNNLYLGVDNNVATVTIGAATRPTFISGPLVALYAHTPATSSEACATGTITFDSAGPYVYVCYGFNAWGRSLLTHW